MLLIDRSNTIILHSCAKNQLNREFDGEGLLTAKR